MIKSLPGESQTHLGRIMVLKWIKRLKSIIAILDQPHRYH